MSKEEEGKPRGLRSAIRKFFAGRAARRAEYEEDLRYFPYPARDNYVVAPANPFGNGASPAGGPPAEPKVERAKRRALSNALSQTETTIYHALLSVVAAHAIIRPKVPLASIFPALHLDRILAPDERVDFLLCEPATMRPMVAIKLQEGNGAEWDEWIARIFDEAALPLLHISAQNGHHTSLATRLAPYLGTGRPPVPPSDSTCPRCDKPMIVYPIKRGQLAGRQVYVCTNYPKCPEVLPYKNSTDRT